MVDKNFWVGKKVLVTGHTGFKGSWLSILLNELGAEVFGLSLEPKHDFETYSSIPKNLFQGELISNLVNYKRLNSFIMRSKPDVIFHLAAQASVLESLSDPQKTWESNVLGTQHLLQSLRLFERRCVCLIVTSDKVYSNNDTGTAFTEDSPLGGNDPYSSSKAATEILVHSYRKSFEIFSGQILLATARAGNVIGGGDWLENRLIPDLVRSFQARETLVVRNSSSIRPWQFVLDALTGYIMLAEELSVSRAANLQSAFNFGPSAENRYSVDDVVNKFSALLPISTTNLSSNPSSKESTVLALDSKKARALLNWSPRLDFDDSLTWTAEWYKLFCQGYNPYEISRDQVEKWLVSET